MCLKSCQKQPVLPLGIRSPTNYSIRDGMSFVFCDLIRCGKPDRLRFSRKMVLHVLHGSQESLFCWYDRSRITADFNFMKGVDIKDYQLLLPIPQNLVDATPLKIMQNPGYWVLPVNI